MWPAESDYQAGVTSRSSVKPGLTGPLPYQYWPGRWPMGQTSAILGADASRDGSARVGVAVTAAVSDLQIRSYLYRVQPRSDQSATWHDRQLLVRTRPPRAGSRSPGWLPDWLPGTASLWPASMLACRFRRYREWPPAPFLINGSGTGVVCRQDHWRTCAPLTLTRVGCCGICAPQLCLDRRLRG